MTLTKFMRAGAVAASALLIGTQANAADIYSAGGFKDAPIYAPASNWTGFYVGANIGAVWGDLETSVVGSEYADMHNTTVNVTGGGQVGYNFQTGSFVFGVETDFGELALSHNQHIYQDADRYTSMDDAFYVDVAGRLGYAAGPALFYIKGGYAYYDGSVSVTKVSTNYTFGASGLDGWTLGGGIEYKLAPAWSLKGEYRHFDFGSVDTTASGGSKVTEALTAEAVTVGLNYHFGQGYSPLK